MATRIWSSKQTAIFAHFASFTRALKSHLVVRARAGTGKTSTIVEALKHVPQDLLVCVCAFGKDIQLELVRQIAASRGIAIVSTGDRKKDDVLLASAVKASGIVVMTLHALGLACVKRFWPNVKVSFGVEREQDLVNRVCPPAPDAIKKLVGTLITKGRLVAPHATKPADLLEVAQEFECVPDEQWEPDYGLNYVIAKALEGMDLAARELPAKTGIDGADMIFLPVRNGWLRKTYDVVIVDEGQDMNACQLEIAEGLCLGSLIVVGDDRQAIFGFAGADSGSLDRLRVKLDATELPLNVTYRCGHAIVREAARYVPDYEAAPTNSPGIVRDVPPDNLVLEASAGDFILSRANAPLVSIAMRLLRAGKRTRVAGRNIGDGLVSLVRKLKARSVPDLLRRIDAWRDRESARVQARYPGKTDSPACISRLDSIADQALMLAELTDGAASIDEVTTRIDALFADDGRGDDGLIVCSSVHKAKGKEADRCFVLASTLRDYSEEELNITYVAITRAKHELVWVR